MAKHITPTRSKVWDKPLTPEKEADIKQAIKDREPKDCAYACLNTPDRLKLIFPVLQDFDATIDA
jgi:hypothetical protein